MIIKPGDMIPAYKLKVFVDDELVLKPYLVDTNQGCVEYYHTDSDGFFIMLGGDIMTGIVYGDVTFKIE